MPRIHNPNVTEKVQSNQYCYYVSFRDRSDESPLALFFMVYSKKDDSVLWESATYYSNRELDRVALMIIDSLMNDALYTALMTRYYNPRGYVIRNHRMINRIAGRMLKNGYKTEKIKQIANIARAAHGLEAI